MKYITGPCLLPFIFAGALAYLMWRGIVTGWNLAASWVDTW
jgi:hypothetical protein